MVCKLFGGFDKMTLEEKFMKKNVELKSKVLDEIKNVQQGLSMKSKLQLETILDELNIMEKHKNQNISYPRIIIDSWDYSDQLGSELIELVNLYKRCN